MKQLQKTVDLSKAKDEFFKIKVMFCSGIFLIVLPFLIVFAVALLCVIVTVIAAMI